MNAFKGLCDKTLWLTYVLICYYNCINWNTVCKLLQEHVRVADLKQSYDIRYCKTRYLYGSIC